MDDGERERCRDQGGKELFGYGERKDVQEASFLNECLLLMLFLPPARVRLGGRRIDTFSSKPLNLCLLTYYYMSTRRL